MADEPTAADKPRILVADDSRVMRHAAKKILGQEYDIVEANDGEEAWEAIQSDTDIQVILCDLQMPNLDGFGVLERLRNAKDARLQDLPFIVITGKEDDEETRKQVLSDGATDFIGKPFESVQLQARTAAALKTRKLSETANVLEEQAVRDPVSGLLKRQHFMDRGSEAVSYVRRHGTALALACIEIDNFKQLFVHHGKDIADQLIAKAAEVMRNTVRHEDVAARLSVGELALLLPATEPAGGARQVERIREAIGATSFEHEGKRFTVTVSAGVTGGAGIEVPEFPQLLEQAQQHLKEAGQNGGNTMVADSAPAGGDTQQAPDLETALAMLERGEKDSVRPHVPYLVERLLPLLEIVDRGLAQALRKALENRREKVGNA